MELNAILVAISKQESLQFQVKSVAAMVTQMKIGKQGNSFSILMFYVQNLQYSESEYERIPTTYISK